MVLIHLGLSCLHVFPHSLSYSVQVLDRLDCLRVMALGCVISSVLVVVFVVLVVSSQKYRLCGLCMDSFSVTELDKS